MGRPVSEELLKKPCRKCGAADRFPSGSCRPCAKGSAPARRAYMKTRPTALKTAATNRWKNRNPEYHRAYNLKKLFFMSLDEYQQQLKDQGGVCGICKRGENHEKNGKPVSFVVDHDHATGHPRGILCGRCNQGLGLLGDSPELLEAAAAYLRAMRG